jgi:hypothetical protein
MNTQKLDLALRRLHEARKLVLEAGVSSNGRVVRDTDALLQQLTLLLEVSTKRAA